MFYDKQDKSQQVAYKNMLNIVGKISRIFSESETPYLYYRAHENIFAKYFNVKNNSRSDDSADACSEDGFGIGLKTWVGQDNQKVAEFGRLRPQYEHLEGMDLVLEIAKYRNKRIKTTLNVHGLKQMLYHIVKRVPGAMCIYEATFDYIDIDNIVLDTDRGNANSIYFSDSKHTYHFSRSKNTLYMNFDEMELLDKFQVEIEEDPYELLSNTFKSDLNLGFSEEISNNTSVNKNQLCLRLYSTKADGTKFIAEKSGLNQWNGARSSYKIDNEGNRYLDKVTPRNPNELYIPYPAEDRERNEDFFPAKDIPFELLLPDGTCISAKVCQNAYPKMDNKKYDNLGKYDKLLEDKRRVTGKSIMSNPNSVLGKWLLRDVLELEEGTVVTYEMLKEYGIDSVIFTKNSELNYSIDFCELGTYERFYNLNDIDIE